MIHSINADYNTFKYKAFFVEIRAIHKNGDVKIKIPLLLDCIDEDTVKKIVENICTRIEEKDYRTSFNSRKDIHRQTEVGLLTEGFKTFLEHQKFLPGYKSFIDKVANERKEVNGSQYFLLVDLSTGINEFEKRKLPILSDKNNYPGLEIEVEEVKDDETSNEK